MSGTAGSIVAPTAPTAPQDADQADPVEVAKAKARDLKDPKSKYGQQKVGDKPENQAPESEEEKNSWIEIELKDKDGRPVPGEAYEVRDMDGVVVGSGSLNDEGKARVEGLKPGPHQVTFPQHDKRAWKPA
jgi:hypothetical protein